MQSGKGLKISKIPSEAEAGFDVVFIQSIELDLYSTWQHGEGASGFSPSWLRKDTDVIDIWFVDYGEIFSLWIKGKLSIIDVSNMLINSLYSKGIGKKPYTLIGHGVGGFFIKGVFSYALQHKDESLKKIINLCESTVFFSVPHTEPGISNYLNYLYARYDFSKKTTEKEYEVVKKISARFLTILESRDIRCMSFYEQYKVGLNAGFRGLLKSLPYNQVFVDDDSASLGLEGEQVFKVEGSNYITISSFLNKKNSCYILLKKFINAGILLSVEEAFGLGDVYDDKPVNIFISYSGEDRSHLEVLRTHLSTIERHRGVGVKIWHDRLIPPGAKWEDSIFKNIDDADIFLCLVSANFIASSYCYEKELCKALEDHQDGKKIVIPIMLHDCFWEELPIGKIEGVPGYWIASCAGQNNAWASVTRSINLSIEQIILRGKKNKEDDLERNISSFRRRISDYRDTLNTEYEDLVILLDENIDEIVDGVFSSLSDKFFYSGLDTAFPSEIDDIDEFKIDVSHFIRRVKIALFESDASFFLTQ